jgi:hypothetical protein
VTMDAVDRVTRWMVYQYFRESGTAPTLRTLSRLVEAPVDDVRASLRRLHDAHALVLSASGSIAMAHPFAAEPCGFRVVVDERTYEANCAWDALAIPPLLGTDARIEATCPVWGEPLRLRVREGQLEPTTSVVHVLVPARSFWEDIGFT